MTRLADEQRAMHDLAAEHGLTLACAWLRGYLPAVVSEEHRRAWERAQACAPSLAWGPLRATVDYHTDLGPAHHQYSAYLYSTPGTLAFLCGGLRWRSAAREPQERAGELARRARRYIADWREPETLSIRDMMRYRLDAVRALLAATQWAVAP